MKKRELIDDMRNNIDTLKKCIEDLHSQKAAWNYVHNLEQDMIHADRNMLDRIIKLEKKAACSCVQAHAMPEADIVCNSHKQVNEQSDDYKDRCNVNKAFDEWKAKNYADIRVEDFAGWIWIEFAVYFAERVKGGKL